MSNDDVSKSRRRFLQGGLVTLPAVGLFGASDLLKAADPTPPYQPTFFRNLSGDLSKPRSIV